MLCYIAGFSLISQMEHSSAIREVGSPKIRKFENAQNENILIDLGIFFFGISNSRIETYAICEWLRWLVYVYSSKFAKNSKVTQTLFPFILQDRLYPIIRLFLNQDHYLLVRADVRLGIPSISMRKS